MRVWGHELQLALGTIFKYQFQPTQFNIAGYLLDFIHRYYILTNLFQLALVLAAVIGLKKLLSSEKHVTYEVVAQPQHEHHEHHVEHGHSGGGYDGGHGGWGRTFDSAAAQNLAYSAHIPPNWSTDFCDPTPYWLCFNFYLIYCVYLFFSYLYVFVIIKRKESSIVTKYLCHWLRATTMFKDFQKNILV